MTFVIADLHFGDAGLCRSSARPFNSAQEMDNELVRRWNATVTAADTVFVLGDLGRRHCLDNVRRLNGHKHLIAGNGDDLTTIARTELFESIAVARWLPGVMLTHIPVHPSQLRGATVNIHGHLHSRSVGDHRYICVSAEHVEYTPVRLAHLLPAKSQPNLL